MKCPYCNYEEIKVVETRETSDTVTRRRRECLKCGKRFTTYEKLEQVEIIVIKKDNTRERFNREKAKLGIIKACEKRPVSAEQIENAMNEIEIELKQKETIEVSSKLIGELIMKKLKKLDKVAYIRFASVYRDFTDINSFQKELKKIGK